MSISFGQNALSFLQFKLFIYFCKNYKDWGNYSVNLLRPSLIIDFVHMEVGKLHIETNCLKKKKKKKLFHMTDAELGEFYIWHMKVY